MAACGSGAESATGAAEGIGGSVVGSSGDGTGGSLVNSSTGSTGGAGGTATLTTTGSSGGSQPDGGKSTGAGGAGGFVHPGILVQKGQLDFLKAKVGASADPWSAAFKSASGSSYASPTYMPQPIATVDCGSYSNPDIGCDAEKDDVAAAYTHALLWYLTGEEAHAQKAIEIMNAWSSVLKAHTNSNAPLQSAWCASVFPRAAEIIRYTYTGWAEADVAAFATMLKDVYLPEVVHGAPNDNGNWELSMAEATMAIGVFLDDQETFDAAVTLWKKRVPAYIYLTSDGPVPVPPPGGSAKSQAQIVSYWQGQSTFVDGIAQETCRDFGHTQLGFAAMINAAETARIQGVDLYTLESKRITAGYEFHANYLDGAAAPSWLCGGTLSQVTPTETWEIGYNAYATRQSLALPLTAKVIAKVRPTGVNHMMAWETLTHAEVGSVGLE
jgi:Alginate lyase